LQKAVQRQRIVTPAADVKLWDQSILYLWSEG
jgi:hypothetical protein